MNRKTIRILMLLLVAMGLGIGEAKAEDNVKYIDAGGVEKTQDNVTVLEGSSSVTDLPGGWYIVTGNNISYTNALSFDGDTYLILADGAELTAETVMMNDNANLTIYSQGGKTLGKEEGKFTSNNEMICGDLIINGGKVSALSPSNGWKSIACVNMIVNGGEVYATTGATFDACIACSGKMTINGGQLTAIRNSDGFGIDCKGVITFGWTKSKDFIKCSSYSVGSSGTVKTATGKRFDAYTYDGSGKETFSTTIEGGMTIDASGLITTVLRPANYKYGVKYLKPNASGSALVEDQTSEGVKVWELIGDETELGTDGEETWYVTTSETATFTNTITLKGNVHIILANGTTMSVGTSGSPIAGSGIVSTGSYNYNLSIHGQEGSTGKLNVFANGDAGIGVKDLTICGGCITSSNIKNDNFCDGIKSTGNLVIYGGQVTSTSTEGGYGIYANIFILGWSDKENDFIQASSYSVHDKQMRTADGKSFAVYSISGTTETLDGVVGEASGHIFLNNDNWSYGGYDYAQAALASKKLRPFEGSVVGAVVGQQYLAYNNKNSGFKLLNGDAKLYVVTSVAYNESKFEVGLTEVDAGMVKAGVPVIFANATEGNPLPVSIYLGNATVTTDPKRLPNFIACDGSTSVANLLPSGLAYGDALFFGLSGNSFKRVLLASDDKPAAGKCFLAVPKQAYMDGTLKLGTEGSSSRSLGIETGGTTSLIDNGQLTMDNSAAAQWYSLDGRRLDKAPKTKGVYIRNGKKLVIR